MPPPPLPSMEPRSRSAEEAVTNILYNTPSPNLQPFKRCVLIWPSTARVTDVEPTDTS
jgi:hypothetical protein